MTLYRRLCGLNYPTVVVVLWSVGAFLVLIGALLVLWDPSWIGLAMVIFGVALIAVPFVLNPWA